MRQIPTSLETLLVEDEGEVLHVYPDGLGFLTLGVGRLVDQRRGGGITKAESRFLLANDISRVEYECDEAFGDWLTRLDDVRAAVIYSLCFQLGLDGLKNFVHFLAACKAGDWRLAQSSLMASKLAKQVPERTRRHGWALVTGEWQ